MQNFEDRETVKCLFSPSYFKADFFKLLSNPVRIQILDNLRLGEQNVNYISHYLEIDASSVSQELGVICRFNLVRIRKQGNFVFYSICDPAIFKVLDAALEAFNSHLLEVRDTLEQMK